MSNGEGNGIGAQVKDPSPLLWRGQGWVGLTPSPFPAPSLSLPLPWSPWGWGTQKGNLLASSAGESNLCETSSLSLKSARGTQQGGLQPGVPTPTSSNQALGRLGVRSVARAGRHIPTQLHLEPPARSHTPPLACLPSAPPGYAPGRVSQGPGPLSRPSWVAAWRLRPRELLVGAWHLCGGISECLWHSFLGVPDSCLLRCPLNRCRPQGHCSLAGSWASPPTSVPSCFSPWALGSQVPAPQALECSQLLLAGVCRASRQTAALSLASRVPCCWHLRWERASFLSGSDVPGSCSFSTFPEKWSLLTRRRAGRICLLEEACGILSLALGMCRAPALSCAVFTAKGQGPPPGARHQEPHPGLPLPRCCLPVPCLRGPVVSAFPPLGDSSEAGPGGPVRVLGVLKRDLGKELLCRLLCPACSCLWLVLSVPPPPGSPRSVRKGLEAKDRMQTGVSCGH